MPFPCRRSAPRELRDQWLPQPQLLFPFPSNPRDLGIIFLDTAAISTLSKREAPCQHDPQCFNQFPCLISSCSQLVHSLYSFAPVFFFSLRSFIFFSFIYLFIVFPCGSISDSAMVTSDGLQGGFPSPVGSAPAGCLRCATNSGAFSRCLLAGFMRLLLKNNNKKNP